MDLETIEAHEFALIYHGRYSLTDIQEMTMDQMFRHAKRLMDQKTKEKDAREDAYRKAKAAAKRKR